MTRLASILLAALASYGCGGGGGNPPPPPPPPPTLGTGPAACTGGAAADFSCSGISLERRMPFGDLGGSRGNDIWGWTDASTNKEYALVGMTNGTAYVDISDAQNPVFLGRLPTATVNSTWRDIKVYSDYAYIVADNAGSHGMQVFDLTRLRNIANPQTFIADTVYDVFGSAHNVAIDENTGFAYAVGSDACMGGLHMIDIRLPSAPMFAGCYSLNDTHDTQCVVYAGPDMAHTGKEICLSSNGDHVEIVDVSIKGSPVPISQATYPDNRYAHQGWLTEDHRYFLLGDELDERNIAGISTRTHVFDLADLDAPIHLYVYEASTSSIDHNLYVLGNRVFQANYTSGLRLLEFTDLSSQDLQEIGHFDTFPASGGASFDGAWSVYPYFPSGKVIVNDIENGLFILSLGI